MSRDDGRPGLRPARITSVTGGAATTRAAYADLAALAAALDAAGADALHRTRACASVAGSPDLLLSAALAPRTALLAETAATAAAAALAAWAADVATVALATRQAGQALRVADAGTAVEVLVVEHALTAAAARWAPRLGDEGPPHVVRTPDHVPLAVTAPGSTTALVEHLAEVNALSDAEHPDGDGTIEVQTVTGADGSRHHLVYLPGTDDMDPFSADDDVRDMGANVHLEGGLPTTYGNGVLATLHDAGVRPGEPVLLAGHSQGGMVAQALAEAGTPYDITDVVTAGSPAVPGDLPAGVQVLSLEHDGDPVPLVDLHANAATPQHITVTFDSGDTGPAGNHGLSHYEAGAAAVDASADPAVQHAVAGLEPFLSHPGDTVHSTVFQITRRDGAR